MSAADVAYQYGIQWRGSRKVVVCDDCGGVDPDCEAATRMHARATGGTVKRRSLGEWQPAPEARR